MEDIHNTVRQLARENRVSEEDLLEALPSSIGNDPVHYSMSDVEEIQEQLRKLITPRRWSRLDRITQRATKTPVGAETMHLASMILKEGAVRRLLRKKAQSKSPSRRLSGIRSEGSASSEDRRSSHQPRLSPAALHGASHTETSADSLRTPVSEMRDRHDHDSDEPPLGITPPHLRTEEDSPQYSPIRSDFGTPSRGSTESKAEDTAALPHKGEFQRTVEEAKRRGELDPSLLCYGTAIMLRTEIPEWMAVAGEGFRFVAVDQTEIKVAGVGVGQEYECFTIINARMRADRGVIHYGDTVLLESLATGKLLGWDDRGGTGSVCASTDFPVLESHKWTLLDPHTLHADGSVRPTYSQEAEDSEMDEDGPSRVTANILQSISELAGSERRGRPIRACDPVAVRSSLKQMLCVSPPAEKVQQNKQQRNAPSTWLSLSTEISSSFGASFPASRTLQSESADPMDFIAAAAGVKSSSRTANSSRGLSADHWGLRVELIKPGSTELSAISTLANDSFRDTTQGSAPQDGVNLNLRYQVAPTIIWSLVPSTGVYTPEWYRKASESSEAVGASASLSSSGQTQALWKLPPQVQESAMVEDILFALVGAEGRYLRLVDLQDHDLHPKRKPTPGRSAWGDAGTLAKSISDVGSEYLTDNHMFVIDVSGNSSAQELSKGFLQVLPEREEQGSSLQSVPSRYLFSRSVHNTAELYRIWKTPIYVPTGTGTGSVGFDRPIKNLEATNLHAAVRVLPICSAVARVRSFIERRSMAESGLVGQALAAAMRVFLQELDTLVAQLEALDARTPEGLSLQRLWFYLQPARQTFQMLEHVAISCSNLTGGALLDAVSRCEATGDMEGREVVRFLLSRCARPFFSSLERWLFCGEIIDASGEFLVTEHAIAGSEAAADFGDKYWEERHQLNMRNVPHFLAPWAQVILSTGKYLNVLRHCGVSAKCPYEKKIEYSTQEKDYGDIITSCHDWASSSLLNHLMDKEQLMNRIASLRSYFFCSYGDYLTHFIDIASNELRKPVPAPDAGSASPSSGPPTPAATPATPGGSLLAQAEYVSLDRLQSLLELSVRTAITADDPFKDDVKCTLERHTLEDMLRSVYEAGTRESLESQLDHSRKRTLRGWQAFCLDYHVSWPVSLVLSRKALVKYQLVFRSLFHWRLIERQLNSTWVQHKGGTLSAWKNITGHVYLLRHRLLQFVQNILYYMTFEVIEPRWHELKQALNKVTSVDDLLKEHEEFLDCVLNECLLRDAELSKALNRISRVCKLFVETSLAASKKAEKLLEIHKEELLISSLGRGRVKETDDLFLYGAGASKYKRGGAGWVIPTSSLRSTSPTPRESKGPSTTLSQISAEQKNYGEAQQKELANSLADNQAALLETEKEFDTWLARLRTGLLTKAHKEYHSYLVHLCTRLDYNHFYSQRERELRRSGATPEAGGGSGDIVGDVLSGRL